MVTTLVTVRIRFSVDVLLQRIIRILFHWVNRVNPRTETIKKFSLPPLEWQIIIAYKHKYNKESKQKYLASAKKDVGKHHNCQIIWL